LNVLLKSEQRMYLDILNKCLSSQRFPTSEAAVCSLYSVLDEIYRPHQGFWAGLEPETLIEAFMSQVPKLCADEIFDWGASFRDEADLQLYMHQFDERCAMRILSACERTSVWVRADLRLVDG
jgi:hypothetical protein